MVGRPRPDQLIAEALVCLPEHLLVPSHSLFLRHGLDARRTWIGCRHLFDADCLLDEEVGVDLVDDASGQVMATVDVE